MAKANAAPATRGPDKTTKIITAQQFARLNSLMDAIRKNFDAISSVLAAAKPAGAPVASQPRTMGKPAAKAVKAAKGASATA